MMVFFPLRIFYDGSCPLCVGEMERYRRHNADGRFVFIDISADSFDPAFHGKSRRELMEQLHVLTGDGQFYVGFDAVLTVWQVLPGSSIRRLLAGIAGRSGLQGLGRRLYPLLARYRHRLSGSERTCSGPRCREDDR